MIGRVDNSARSLLLIELHQHSSGEKRSIEVWVDTGFIGDLVLPQSLIDDLGLVSSGVMHAVLADGSKVNLAAYTCEFDWFGVARKLEIVANDGAYPLLGVGLLLGKELRVDYRNLRLTLLPVAKLP